MPRQDHDDLKSGGMAGWGPSSRTSIEQLEAAASELDTLKDLIRSLYNDSISCDDAGDFTLGVQAQLEALIRSWGEAPLTPEEYEERQRAAEERARDEAEFERLRRKLGK